MCVPLNWPQLCKQYLIISLEILDVLGMALLCGENLHAMGTSDSEII